MYGTSEKDADALTLAVKLIHVLAVRFSSLSDVLNDCVLFLLSLSSLFIHTGLLDLEGSLQMHQSQLSSSDRDHL